MLKYHIIWSQNLFLQIILRIFAVENSQEDIAGESLYLSVVQIINHR